MDSGIGRTGIRVLAVFMLVIGGLGVSVIWNGMPGGPGTLAGLGLGIVVLALISLTALAFPGGRRVRRPKTKKVKKSKQAKPAPVDEIDMLDASPQGEFEFTDLEMLEPAPAPVSVPVEPVADPRDWPVRPNARHPTAPVSVTQSPHRRELQAKYTQRTPLVRGILAGTGSTAVYEEIPEVVAEVPPPGLHVTSVPAGMTRGKCSGCSTVVLAPTARPIRLRCPRCSKTQMLRA